MPSLKSNIGNAKHISLDDVCFLISVSYTEDELGQPIETETERQVFGSKLSISRAEFSAAGQLGHKPLILLIIDSDEYDKENSLKYENQNYRIYKDFMRTDGFTELYCEVKSGG
ncbi:phage head closure protein [Peribacillus alkalitolerans]|uniref:phage head closure protein n=1 Tax=Peribacillus alkalitolerans TaxID=1550385 RepID=UPI0013D0F8EC|nr:phage head closure protein [Peribacillus alkalitolerans]